MLEDLITARMLTFLELTYNPLLEMMCPNNFPDDTSKVHFAKLRLRPMLLRVSRVSFRLPALSAI